MKCHLAARVIIWDEIHSQTREVFDAAMAATNNFAGKILIVLGDIKQTLGIAEDDSRSALLANLVVSSKMWPKFQLYEFTENLRMTSTNLSAAERLERTAYIKTIEAVGLGLTNDNVLHHYGFQKKS